MSTETGTPSPEAPSVESTPTEGQPATPPKVDTKRLHAAVQRTVQGRQQEKAWQQEKAALEPTLKIQALWKAGKFAEAFKAMAGNEGFLPAYQSLTEEVVGAQGDEKAYQALPARVREQLAKVQALEARAARVDALEAEVQVFKKSREEAQQQLQVQQQQQAILNVFREGAQAVGELSGELDMLPQHPDGQRLVYAEWMRLASERQGALVKLSAAERKAALSALVADAARAVDKTLVEQHGWVLSTPHAGRTLGASHYPAPQPPAPAPPPRQPVRVSPPGSLGEPSGVDWDNLPKDERLRRMREDERRNPYVR